MNAGSAETDDPSGGNGQQIMSAPQWHTGPVIQNDSAVQQIPWHYQPPWNPDKWRKEEKERRIREWKGRLKQFGAVCTLTLFIYLAFALLIMLWIAPEVMHNLSDRRDSLILITPAVIDIISISGTSLVIFFTLLVATITISYLLVTKRSAMIFVKEISDGKPGRHSIMLTVGGLYFAILFLTQIFYLGIQSGGAEPNIPEIDHELWIQIYTFAKASVWEEVISRILLIGIPLMGIDIFFRKGGKLPAKRYILGGGHKLEYVECGLILFSAELFALAHIESWDLWKTIPTFIAGLCFGYLFLKIGFYAAVFFHFSFDFLSIPLEYFGESALLYPLGLLILLWLACGLMFFINYSIKLGEFVSRDLLKLNRSKMKGISEVRSG